MTHGFEVQYIINPLNVVEFIGSFKPNIILLDLNFSVETTGEEGLKILKEVVSVYPGLPVILLTAWGTMDLAVAGMKSGAVDFVTKPWNNESMVSAVRTQLNLKQEQNSSSSIRLDNIVGKSEAINHIKSVLLNVATTDASVLITGEQGTGKDLIAEAIHDLSPRAEYPFVKSEIFEHFDRELLGYRRAAFSGAVSDSKGLFMKAGGGTLLFDKVEEISVSVQAKLIKILEERKFEPIGSGISEKLRARFISTSITHLKERVEEGTFREDLFYKLSLVHIHLPALRDRQEDIPVLANFFLEKFNQGDKKRKIEESALEWLSTQEFPGNVRQLKNFIERTWLLSEGYSINIKELKKNVEPANTKHASVLTLEEMEKQMILKAILLKKGNMSEVAKNLGITRSALYRRMSKFGLTNPNGDEN